MSVISATTSAILRLVCTASENSVRRECSPVPEGSPDTTPISGSISGRATSGVPGGIMRGIGPVGVGWLDKGFSGLRPGRDCGLGWETGRWTAAGGGVAVVSIAVVVIAAGGLAEGAGVLSGVAAAMFANRAR